MYVLSKKYLKHVRLSKKIEKKNNSQTCTFYQKNISNMYVYQKKLKKKNNSQTCTFYQKKIENKIHKHIRFIKFDATKVDH